MTYLEKLMSAVKVDDELLTPREAEQLRNTLSEFFPRTLPRISCPRDFLDDCASSSPCYRLDFNYDCVQCWNQEAR